VFGFEISALVWIAAVFLLAGTVKGVIGLGLPSISLGLLAATMDLRMAMILLLVPNVATNLWQAFIGGHFFTLLRRLWPFLLAASIGIWFGAAWLDSVDTKLLSALLGLLLVIYAIIGLMRPPVAIAPQHEGWAGPLVGAINGVLTGLTGSFVVPGVLYLQSLGLTRDQLVQAMGMLFMASTLALGAALGGRDMLGGGLLWVSLAGVVPAVVGMVAGQGLRGRLSEAVFRKLFYIALLLLGLYIVVQYAAGRLL
jgi:uncharacterized membrane protein YfcA